MQNKIEILKQKLRNKRIFKGVSKEKRILGILIVLLIGFLLYQSLIVTQLLRLKAVDFQFMSFKKLINFYSWLMKHTDVLINEAKEKEIDIARIRKRFISEEELPNYFTNFRNRVKSHNLGLVSLDFKPQEPVRDLSGKLLEYFQKLPLDISIKGSFFNIMSLLYKFERDVAIFDIKSIRIRSVSPDSYEVLMDVKATIYILMGKS